MAIALSEKRFRVVLRNLMYLRNFEGVIKGLADRGYKIYITTSPKDRKVPPELRELASALPMNATIGGHRPRASPAISAIFCITAGVIMPIAPR